MNSSGFISSTAARAAGGLANTARDIKSAPRTAARARVVNNLRLIMGLLSPLEHGFAL